jgi:hypothetical protein
MNSAAKSVKKTDKVSLLRSEHSEMMHEFSRQCVNRLNNNRAFRLFLSPFHHFVEANVAKEIEKDALIIGYAAVCFEGGRGAGDMDMDEIFEKTKNVDRAFLEKLPSLLKVDVRYDDFKEIRKERIATLVSFVTELLKNWENSLSFSDLVRKTYGEKSFRKIIIDSLHLYNLETRMVGSNSIALPSLARRIKEHLVRTLFIEMEGAARDIADEYANKIYRSADYSCPDRT